MKKRKNKNTINNGLDIDTVKQSQELSNELKMPKGVKKPKQT